MNVADHRSLALGEATVKENEAWAVVGNTSPEQTNKGLQSWSQKYRFRGQDKDTQLGEHASLTKGHSSETGSDASEVAACRTRVGQPRRQPTWWKCQVSASLGHVGTNREANRRARCPKMPQDGEESNGMGPQIRGGKAGRSEVSGLSMFPACKAVLRSPPKWQLCEGLDVANGSR